MTPLSDEVTLESEQLLTVRFSNPIGIRMSPLSGNKTFHFSEVFCMNEDGAKLRSHPISTDWIGPMMVNGVVLRVGDVKKQ